jgi:hypothetical protein
MADRRYPVKSPHLREPAVLVDDPVEARRSTSAGSYQAAKNPRQRPEWASEPTKRARSYPTPTTVAGRVNRPNPGKSPQSHCISSPAGWSMIAFGRRTLRSGIAGRPGQVPGPDLAGQPWIGLGVAKVFKLIAQPPSP